MKQIPVIAIFDIGKTNKKLFLFDEGYNVVYERSIRLNEITDEDGDPCEDLVALRQFVVDSLNEVSSMDEFDIRAVNFSTYGASFVYVDENGNPISPLYNYLKSFPALMQQEFYQKYGGESAFSLATASPPLGSLNSGLQLYRFKHEKPAQFQQIKYALHLPQYISSLLTKQAVTEITSIGCHTALWDFANRKYHHWVENEDLSAKMPPLVPADTTVASKWNNKEIVSGIGMHDSSAALIPYLVNFEEPFVLISTGTWSISMNPFNDIALSDDELKQDCLCYITYKGHSVKASRLFAGNEHETEVKRLATLFNKPLDYYKQVRVNLGLIDQLANEVHFDSKPTTFNSYEEAYHAMVWEIVKKQKHSTGLVMKGTAIKRIFIDGGFSQNEVYMTMLSTAMPEVEIYSASMAQATALGAALAIHEKWNKLRIRKDLITLKYFSAHSICK